MGLLDHMSHCKFLRNFMTLCIGIFEFVLLFKVVLCCVLPSRLMKEYVQWSVSRGHTVWEISYTVAVSVVLLMGIMHLDFPVVGVHSGH